MPALITTILLYFWELVKTWGLLFAAPFANLEILWIIIPTYLNWIFAEFFQEKRGTSLGNAISNATIVVWVAIDWSRTSTRFFLNDIISKTRLISNIAVSVLVFAYGIWVVYEGVKGKDITHYIGRVRVVTYIILMITPLIYNADISITKAAISIILFFPVFYLIIELFDRLLPDPVSIREDEEKSGALNSGTGLNPEMPDMGLNFSNDFGNIKSKQMDDIKNFKM